MRLKRIGMLAGGWLLIVYGCISVMFALFMWLSPSYISLNEEQGMNFERHMRGVGFNMALIGMGIAVAISAPRRSRAHWHMIEGDSQWESTHKISGMAAVFSVATGVLCAAAAIGLLLGGSFNCVDDVCVFNLFHFRLLTQIPMILNGFIAYFLIRGPFVSSFDELFPVGEEE